MRDVAPRDALQAPEMSLLTAARLNPPGRWENGFTIPPGSCGNLTAYDPCGSGSVDLLDRDNPGQDYDPVALQALFSCSTGTSRAGLDTAREQAPLLLEALTPYGVEHELWTGELAREADFANRRFVVTDADLAAHDTLERATVLSTGVANGGVTPRAALGYLEEALGSYPGRSFIHTSMRGGPFLGFEAARTGNLLVTKQGSVLVCGRGYPGTGPDGTAAPAGTTWVYGTGPVTVRLTPPVVPAENSEALDRALNTATVRAERLMAATWDGCALFAVLMAVDPTASEF